MNKVKIEDTEVFKQVTKVIGEEQAKIELFKASKNWIEDDIKDILNGEDLSGCFSWGRHTTGSPVLVRYFFKGYIMNKTIEDLAKKLYYQRMGFSEERFPYMWNQCSEDYKSGWLYIARLEVEDELEMLAAFKEVEDL